MVQTRRRTRHGSLGDMGLTVSMGTKVVSRPKIITRRDHKFKAANTIKLTPLKHHGSTPDISTPKSTASSIVTARTHVEGNIENKLSTSIVKRELPQHVAKFTSNRADSVLSRHLLNIRTPEDFSLSATVCSYGYFCLPPQSWKPSADPDKDDDGVFERPLRYGKDLCNSVHVRITQPNIGLLVIEEIVYETTETTSEQAVEPTSHGGVEFSVLNEAELKQVQAQVVRMLRLNEDMSGFHAVHPEAKSRGFGRMYRSPTVWEDCVKTITSSNMKWAGTVKMNALMCMHYGKKGSFPVPSEFPLDPEELKVKCKVGYRAQRIIELAQLFQSPPAPSTLPTFTYTVNGVTVQSPSKPKRSSIASKTDNNDMTKEEKKVRTALARAHKKKHQQLDNLSKVMTMLLADDPTVVVPDSQDAFLLVKSLNGFGDFAASNVMQLLGYYNHVPADSETVRLFREHHIKELRVNTQGTKNYDNLFAHVRAHYNKYDPYQFLFYWFDLWLNYENKTGIKSTRWLVERLVTGQGDNKGLTFPPTLQV
eukprot:CFRG1459T1